MTQSTGAVLEKDVAAVKAKIKKVTATIGKTLRPSSFENISKHKSTKTPATTNHKGNKAVNSRGRQVITGYLFYLFQSLLEDDADWRRNPS